MQEICNQIYYFAYKHKQEVLQIVLYTQQY